MKFKILLISILIILFPTIAISAYAFSSPNIKTSSPVSFVAPIGTQSNPYIINSIADYNTLTEAYKNNSNIYLKLNCDLTETSSEPLNRIAFNSNLDGNNKTITYTQTPLFSEISGIVSNLNFSLTSPNCTTEAFGMLCNELNGALINCSNNSPNATITKNSNTTCIGGFSGRNSSSAEIINCTNNSSLTISTKSAVRLGGFLGEANNIIEISNSKNNGDITLNLTSTTPSASLYAGGFVGYGCYKSTSNTETTYNFKKLNSTGKITIQSSNTNSTYCRIGGIIGGVTNNTITKISESTSSAILSATNSTNSSSGNHIGGILGYIHGAANNFASLDIENCFTSGSITSNNTSSGQSFIGGLVGFSYIKGTNNSENNPEATIRISNSYSNLNLIANDNKTTVNSIIGGLIGQSAKTTILNSFSQSQITSQSQSGKYMGGLIGCYYNNSTPTVNPTISNTISNTSFSYRSSSSAYCGGLIGYLNGSSTSISSSIFDCTFKSSSTITASISTACKNSIGNQSSLIPNISSDTNNDDVNNPNSSLYSTWDFANIWIFENSTPLLRFTL